MGQLLGGDAHLDGEGGFCNELGGIGSQDVDSDEAVGRGFSDQFHKAVVVADTAGAGVGFEGKLGCFVGDVSLFSFFFGEADGSYFRMGIGNVRDGEVIDSGAMAGDEFSDGDPLFGGFMGEHGAVDEVAYGKDVGLLGLEGGIDGDKSFGVGGKVGGG